jgi:hypothetical protein
LLAAIKGGLLVVGCWLLVVGCWLLVVGGKIKGQDSTSGRSRSSFCRQQPATSNQQPLLS